MFLTLFFLLFIYLFIFNLNLTEQTGRLAYKTWLHVSLDNEVV